jgi:hypothetical protein
VARKLPHDPLFFPDGRPRCGQCAQHSESGEGHETRKLFSLVYELAGYGPTHEGGALIPEELHLRSAYYQAYHDRGHLSYAELGLEEVPTDD